MKKEIQIINQYGLTPGDSLTVPKSILNAVQHYALYLGHDEHGRHWMCENMINNGVRLIRVEDFFKGVIKLTSLTKFMGTHQDRISVVQKALSKLGQPYDLINYNCEHFVNEVLHNRVKSYQADAAKAFVGVAAAIVFIALIMEG